MPTQKVVQNKMNHIDTVLCSSNWVLDVNLILNIDELQR